MKKLSLRDFFSDGLCIFIALLPISLLSGELIINIFTILISIFFILELSYKKKFDFLNDWSFYLIIFLWLTFLINLIFSQDSSLGLFRSIGFLRFVLLVHAIKYIFLYREKDYKKTILNMWLIVFIVVNLDLVIEYFNGKNILGFKSKLDGRLASFLNDELKIGGYYLGFTFIAISTIYQFYNKKRLIFTTLLAIFLIISFIIGERSNFLKLFLISIFLSFIFFNKSRIKIFSTIALCFLIFLLIIFNDDKLKYRYVEQSNMNDITNNIYFKHYETAILIFEKYPIFGVGIKNFRVEIKNLVNDQFKDDKSYNNRHILTTHPHQINFELIAETGLFGFLSYLIFMTISLFKAYKSYIFNRNILLLSTGLFCFIYINPVLPSGSFFTTYAATIFWINYGIMLAFSDQKNEFIKTVK